MYLHSKCLHPDGNFTTDPAQSKNGQSFTIKFISHISFTIPYAVLKGGASLGYVAESNNQRLYRLTLKFNRY